MLSCSRVLRDGLQELRGIHGTYGCCRLGGSRGLGRCCCRCLCLLARLVGLDQVLTQSLTRCRTEITIVTYFIGVNCEFDLQHYGWTI